MFITCWKIEPCQKHFQAMTFIDWIYHKINRHRQNRREKQKKKKKDEDEDDDDLNDVNEIIAIVEIKSF